VPQNLSDVPNGHALSEQDRRATVAQSFEVARNAAAVIQPASLTFASCQLPVCCTLQIAGRRRLSRLSALGLHDGPA
jgi:hypothetical protein